MRSNSLTIGDSRKRRCRSMTIVGIEPRVRRIDEVIVEPLALGHVRKRVADASRIVVPQARSRASIQTAALSDSSCVSRAMADATRAFCRRAGIAVDRGEPLHQCVVRRPLRGALELRARIRHRRIVARPGWGPMAASAHSRGRLLLRKAAASEAS